MQRDNIPARGLIILIEAMSPVAVAAVFASITLPSYTAQVCKYVKQAQQLQDHQT